MADMADFVKRAKEIASWSEKDSEGVDKGLRADFVELKEPEPALKEIPIGMVLTEWGRLYVTYADFVVKSWDKNVAEVELNTTTDLMYTEKEARNEIDSDEENEMESVMESDIITETIKDEETGEERKKTGEEIEEEARDIVRSPGYEMESSTYEDLWQFEQKLDIPEGVSEIDKINGFRKPNDVREDTSWEETFFEFVEKHPENTSLWISRGMLDLIVSIGDNLRKSHWHRGGARGVIPRQVAEAIARGLNMVDEGKAAKEVSAVIPLWRHLSWKSDYAGIGSYGKTKGQGKMINQDIEGYLARHGIEKFDDRMFDDKSYMKELVKPLLKKLGEKMEGEESPKWLDESVETAIKHKLATALFESSPVSRSKFVRSLLISKVKGQKTLDKFEKTGKRKNPGDGWLAEEFESEYNGKGKDPELVVDAMRRRGISDSDLLVAVKELDIEGRFGPADVMAVVPLLENESSSPIRNPRGRKDLWGYLAERRETTMRLMRGA